jgi:hypothetical protein
MSDRIGSSSGALLDVPENSHNETVREMLVKFKPLKPLKKLKSLLNKSATIQLHIEDEIKKKHPDWFRIITLKKQRLMIKDKIQRMRRKKSGGWTETPSP